METKPSRIQNVLSLRMQDFVIFARMGSTATVFIVLMITHSVNPQISFCDEVEGSVAEVIPLVSNQWLQERLDRSQQHLKDKEYSKAEEIYEKLIERIPDSVLAKSGLIRALMYQKKREPAALRLAQWHRQQIQSGKKSPWLEKLQVVATTFFQNEHFEIFSKGYRLLEGGHLEEAWKQLLRIPEVESANIEVLIRKAQVLIFMKKPAEALEILKIAEKIHPFEPEIDLWEGRCYLLLDQLAEAVKQLKKAQEQLPQSESAVLWLSEAYQRLNQMEKVFDLLDEDLVLHPMKVRVLLRRAEDRLAYLVRAHPQSTAHFLAIRKDVQLAMSRLEEYGKWVAKGRFESRLGLALRDQGEVEAKIGKLASDVNLLLKKP